MGLTRSTTESEATQKIAKKIQVNADQSDDSYSDILAASQSFILPLYSHFAAPILLRLYLLKCPAQGCIITTSVKTNSQVQSAQKYTKAKISAESKCQLGHSMTAAGFRFCAIVVKHIRHA